MRSTILPRAALMAVAVAVLLFALPPARAAGPERSPAARAGGPEGFRPLHTDIFTIGLSGGDPISGHIQIVSLTWKQVHLTCLDFSVGGSVYNRTLNLTVGPTVGLGGHHGHRSRFSQWFVTGLWYGEMYLEWFMSTHKYFGLFIPAGYEFRQRWGKGDRAVMGARIYVAWSPVGDYDSAGGGGGGGFCIFCPDTSARIKLPFMAGVSLFIGR